MWHMAHYQSKEQLAGSLEKAIRHTGSFHRPRVPELSRTWTVKLKGSALPDDAQRYRNESLFGCLSTLIVKMNIAIEQHRQLNIRK